MVDKLISEAVWRRAVLYYGEEGVAAATLLGYVGRTGGLEVTVGGERAEYMVEDLDGPAILKTTSRDVRFKGALVQFHTDAIKHILGITPVGNAFTVGGSGGTTERTFSIKIIATTRGGDSIVYDSRHVQVATDASFVFTEEALTEMAFEFRALDDDDDGMLTITVGANATATISTGALTRTAGAGYHLVAGEGDAADVLDSITGTSLTDGEVLVLQVADEDNAITLTHLNGTLELDGDVDWIMDNAGDWIELVYASATTSWSEQARYNAAA